MARGLVVPWALFWLCGLQDAVRGQVEPLVQPPRIESSDGLLDTTLTIEYTDFEGPFYSFTNARWLNGIMPGPTLVLSPGDTLRILYENKLVQQEGTIFPDNNFTLPDHSNLHFHGGHVPGELPSDDIRVAVNPGESFQYETHFPENHMPGTHWIHPHVHGSSSLQVGGGACLAMIVRDAEGSLPAQVEEAKEVLLVVQTMDFEEINEVIAEHQDRMMTATVSGFLQIFHTVNGQYQPIHTMQPGEWQRWRIVNGGWLEDLLGMHFENDECEMQLLAKDGIYIRDYPRTLTVLPMAAGNRADVMVRCSTAGSYKILDGAGLTMMSVSVTGDTVESSDLEAWTPTYPDYLTDLRNTQADDGCACTTYFEECGEEGEEDDEEEEEEEDDEEEEEEEDEDEDEEEEGEGEEEEESSDDEGGEQVCINGRLFKKEHYIHTVKFGSVVERTIIDFDDHPYHQHVYPYQIISFDPPLADPHEAIYYQVGDWHDVMQAETEVAVVRYKADVHTGVIMLHCHILPHEDTGTMSQELVVEDGECSCEAFETKEAILAGEVGSSDSSDAGSTTTTAESAAVFAQRAVWLLLSSAVLFMIW